MLVKKDFAFRLYLFTNNEVSYPKGAAAHVQTSRGCLISHCVSIYRISLIRTRAFY